MVHTCSKNGLIVDLDRYDDFELRRVGVVLIRWSLNVNFTNECIIWSEI